MKRRQPTRQKSKRPIRPARTETPPAAPEERRSFGQRRPREIELERAPARVDTEPNGGRNGSFLRALVDRILG